MGPGMEPVGEFAAEPCTERGWATERRRSVQPWGRTRTSREERSRAIHGTGGQVRGCAAQNHFGGGGNGEAKLEAGGRLREVKVGVSGAAHRTNRNYRGGVVHGIGGGGGGAAGPHMERGERCTAGGRG